MTNPHIAAAALAALLVATAPVAYAETAAHSRMAAATGGETMIQPDQIRASKMIGSAVHDVQNRRIGRVKDLVLDRDGQVASVVVDVGAFLGMGGKYVAVNLRDLKTDHNRLTLDMTKEQLQQAQDTGWRTAIRGPAAPPRRYTADTSAAAVSTARVFASSSVTR
jgi:sporulation protein YlmC with PRC-barrel domain